MDPQPPSYEEAMSDQSPGRKEKEPTAPPMPELPIESPGTTNLPIAPSPYDNEDLCPVCRTGTLRKTYSFLGVCLAIVLFPCGILCCLKLTDRVCDNENCGATY